MLICGWFSGTLSGIALLSALFPAVSTFDKSSGCYRAAVFDHVPQVQAGIGGGDIDLNLQVYESAAKLAKENDADIIVYPEDGIIFGLRGRQDALQYGEKIPDAKTAICTDSFKLTHPIIHRLACLARDNHMFIVADLIDVQECSQASDSKCPIDKKYAFNTAVLFDREGVLLAKYHKMHPFGEMLLNPPPHDELVVVDTELGRLGLQVCFDLIYSTPGVVLASENKIDTMLFPTWWFDQVPFLAASQFQMAWSFGNKINLLASNIHRVEIGSRGSGIYSGAMGQFEDVNVADARARVLVANVPVSHRENIQCNLNSKTIEVPQKVPIHSNVVYRFMVENITEVEVLKLDLTQETASKCARGVCCTLQYKVDSETVKSTEEFYLIATNRSRPGAYPWVEEFCGLVHCSALYPLEKCTLLHSNSPIQTKFNFAQLSGNFSENTFIYPTVIGAEHQLLKMSDGLWTYADTKATATSKQNYVLTFGEKTLRKSYTVATVGLYGRFYSRDPPYVQVPAISHPMTHD